MDVNDSIVITGISGRFAAADSVDEFERCLYEGVNLVSESDRWPKDFFGLSNQIAFIKDLSKFDAQFFGINDNDAELLDPQIRILIEVIFESICDAGESRDSVKGSKTGIYFASFYNEIDRNLRAEDIDYFNLRQTFLGWLSYAFDITGPCYMYETACSSSCTAIVEAFNALKHGLINYAIITTSNMNFSPSYGLIFQKLGLVSADGKCRFLDANASGYVKSEAVTSFILQKQSTAKR
ncbi:Fatty acid synthase-like protein, partial [Leptotrombidium deliense]